MVVATPSRCRLKKATARSRRHTHAEHEFKEHLIHDISPADFADLYAETIAYGLFAARLHDTRLDTFSRQEALELLPKSNPFLRFYGCVNPQNPRNSKKGELIRDAAT